MKKNLKLEDIETCYKQGLLEIKQLRQHNCSELAIERFYIIHFKPILKLNEKFNALITNKLYQGKSIECMLSFSKSDAQELIKELDDKYPKLLCSIKSEYGAIDNFLCSGWKLRNGNFVTRPVHTFFEFYEFGFTIYPSDLVTEYTEAGMQLEINDKF